MRKNLALAAALTLVVSAAFFASVAKPASAGAFPGRIRCGFSNFYVDYRQTFPLLPPQITVFTRDPNGTWHLVMWYRYDHGIYTYTVYPTCTNGAKVRTIPTQGVNVTGRAGGIGKYALHCRYTAAVEFQQQWSDGHSVLYIANGHTNKGYVRTIFDPKHTQVAFNTHFCQVSTRDLPVFPVAPILPGP